MLQLWQEAWCCRQQPTHRVRSFNWKGGTSTQTNTAPEQVFLNKYSGTVRTQNFNDNWKFYLGDASGAQTPAFDDSSWDQVNLPHDYSIDQKYSQKMEAESGYLPGGTGWYRKTLL